MSPMLEDLRAPLPGPAMPARSASDPDPEVPAKARRRTFTAKYKLEIVEKAEACSKPGEIGKLLRQEGLYSSHLSTWRRQHGEGVLAALGPKKRGPRPVPSQSRRVAELEQENARLRKKLEQAETIIEVQKKLSQLLEASR